MKPARVLLADDHTLLRSGVRALLERMACVEVVGEASTGREAIERARTLHPELILLDIAMPELTGLEALPRLKKEFPAIKVLMLSAHLNEEYVIRALRGGASGYMLKDAATEELEQAIRAVMAGKTYLSPAISRPVIDSYLQRVGNIASPLDQLTPRQREILQGIAEGRSTKEIAHDLGISAKTVETHRAQLMERLEIREVAGLVRYAIRCGLISAES
jgi:DNA-binding NarL/FixJ family response regulator